MWIFSCGIADVVINSSSGSVPTPEKMEVPLNLLSQMNLFSPKMCRVRYPLGSLGYFREGREPN